MGSNPFYGLFSAVKTFTIMMLNYVTEFDRIGIPGRFLRAPGTLCCDHLGCTWILGKAVCVPFP